LFSRESALLFLNPGWAKITKKLKKSISSILAQILFALKHLTQKQPDAVNNCEFLLSLMKNPWGHHNLSKLLYGNPSQAEGNLLK